MSTSRIKKPWKARIVRMNRQLASGCARHGLPLHKVTVRRIRYITNLVLCGGGGDTRKVGDLVNAETGEIVENGFFAEEYDTTEALLRLVERYRDATTPEESATLKEVFDLTEARARELRAEASSFNRWHSARAREVQHLPREERLAAFRVGRRYNPETATAEEMERQSRKRSQAPKESDGREWVSKLVTTDDRWSSPAPVRVLYKDGKPV